MNDTQNIQRLPLILMQALHPLPVKNTSTSPAHANTHLNLHIKHLLRVHLQPKRGPDMVRQALLVLLLDLGPFCTKRRVLREGKEFLKLVEVFEPHFLLDFECLGDER